MRYQLAYQSKDGTWNVDRSPLRTYKTYKAAKAAIEFMMIKDGVKIVRAERINFQ